jgi:hypothetical protein
MLTTNWASAAEPLLAGDEPAPIRMEKGMACARSEGAADPTSKEVGKTKKSAKPAARTRGQWLRNTGQL